jgi:hypothetical protein
VQSAWLIPLKTRELMCDKCLELDSKIEHYRRISGSILDEVMIGRLNELIAKLEAEKTALHRERKD